MAGAAALKSRKRFIPERLVGTHGSVSSDRTRRHRRHPVCVDLHGLHDHDEDHGPVAGLRHPPQSCPDRNGDPGPQLPDHHGAVVGAGAQCLPAAPDAATDPRRQEIGQQRSLDGLAEAVHDRTHLQGRRDRLLQGREGRGHGLHRQWPLPSGGIRHRTAGRRHRRRTRHAGAVEGSHADGGMHRRRPDSLRQLQQGRGALCAKSCLRFLFPASCQRATVPEHREAGGEAGPGDRSTRGKAGAGVSVGSMAVFSDIRESLRYLFADIIGEQDDSMPHLPAGLPEAAVPVTSNAIHLLIEYQGTRYARLYVERITRFVGRRGVDEAMLLEIARLMAMRMSYEDAIRIAQLKLLELEACPDTPRADDVRKLRLDEMVEALPTVVAEPVLDVLNWLGWAHKRVSIHFSTASRFSIRRLKIEASLRRWRRYSIRYSKERNWVERWLHMVDRALTRQPAAALAIVDTASMVQGYGDAYRHGLADWHAIIDGLAKPTFDGVLQLTDLAGAIAEARAAAMPDARQAALKRKIAEIRARAAIASTNAAAE